MIKENLNIIKEDDSINYNIARYILDCEDIFDLTASNIANECYVSNSTVTKFVKRLGYNTFIEFKNDYLKETFKLQKNSTLNIDSFTINNYANEVLRTLINTTLVIQEENVKHVVDLMHGSETILLFGIGGSSVVAQDFYVKLLRKGYNVKYESDESLRKTLCEKSDDKTVAIIFSYNGPGILTRECIDILNQNKSKVVIVTNNESNHNEDIKIMIDSIEVRERDYSIFSRIAMNFISDIMYLYLLKK